MNSIIGLFQFIINHAPELSGIVLPPVVDWLNKDVHNTQERQLVAILLCLAVAVIFKWNSLASGSIDQWAVTFGIIYTECNNVYKFYFKNSSLRQSLLQSMETPEVAPASSPS